jgi:cell division protein FtsW (lipid II flippase)
MAKLILLSIVAVTVAIPALAARERNPRRALRKALTWTFIGIVAYVLSVIFLYPRFVG